MALGPAQQLHHPGRSRRGRAGADRRGRIRVRPCRKTRKTRQIFNIFAYALGHSQSIINGTGKPFVSAAPIRWIRVSDATVQRLAPTGGEGHANAVTSASSGAQYRLDWPGRCTSFGAYSGPRSSYAARVRQTVLRPTPRTCMIRDSGILRSRAARMWARLTSRAMCSPWIGFPPPLHVPVCAVEVQFGASLGLLGYEMLAVIMLHS